MIQHVVGHSGSGIRHGDLDIIARRHAGSRGRLAAETTQFLTRICTCPSLGTASLALTTRLTRAASSWFLSTMQFHRSGSQLKSSSIVSPRLREETLPIRDEIGDLRQRRFAGGPSGEAQQPLRDLSRFLSSSFGGQNHMEQSLRRARGSAVQPVLNQLQIAGDDREQIIEIMRDATGEPADEIELLSMP